MSVKFIAVNTSIDLINYQVRYINVNSIAYLEPIDLKLPYFNYVMDKIIDANNENVPNSIIYIGIIGGNGVISFHCTSNIEDLISLREI